jgi:nitrile hydratase subunit beta
MSARFAAGEHVHVRRADPPGHLRTPFYARGKHGVVERYLGEFPNPEELAYGRSGLLKQPLYRIRFLQRDLWPHYAGSQDDTVDIEIYEHWLER